MPLFEVAIIQQPTKKELEDGTGAEKLLFGPKAVLAKDNQTAAITAILAESQTVVIDMARSQVIVRPFA
jgi:hypothetical protein